MHKAMPAFRGGANMPATEMCRASSKINSFATSSSGARLAISKIVKSKREVRRECEDYQSLTEYERRIAERDELKKYD